LGLLVFLYPSIRRVFEEVPRYPVFDTVQNVLHINSRRISCSHTMNHLHLVPVMIFVTRISPKLVTAFHEGVTSCLKCHQTVHSIKQRQTARKLNIVARHAASIISLGEGVALLGGRCRGHVFLSTRSQFWRASVPPPTKLF